ncbi:hypothetical protein G195_006182 [Phytophthora kernoviae 00238/432]|uniref:UmuC domain-containing protein n=1 Tax=Phytophthora kernoviae 00238/432 TaxID=1284355 RepID=A0A8J4SBV8_9STRA|nr:hypothetical protein G195_006182 [Phytophthora kernoviae 00238/432]
MKFPAAGDGTKRARVIIHLDLDCFYAQVEQRRLKIPDGEPVAAQQWGSLLAVNYIARKFGVERGDFVDDAKKKCPQIHVPHVDTLGENRKPGQLYDRTHQKAILRRYRVASREIFAVLGSIVSVVEKASIDEAFMDVTEMAQERLAQMSVLSSDFCQDPANHDTKVVGISLQDKEAGSPIKSNNTCVAFPLTEVERLLCTGAVIAREIREAIFSKLGYTCSTGIAGNKLIAKLASPLNKPNGQVVVAPRFVAALMKDLPMRKVRGLGGKLGKQLERIYENLNTSASTDSSGKDNPSTTDASDEKFHKVTAYMFLQRCGLEELTKYVGHETASFVHQICQGNDGNEPVEEKRVLVKMLGCVKQFDQRSGSALVRIEQLEYWVRLLCEEMVMRCEDERIENKRFPSQLTIQFTRTGPEEKPRTRKLGIALDTTVYELYTAAMNVMRLHLDSVFPCAALSMHAKNFHALDSKAVTTISTFFTRNSEHIAQRMEGDTKQFAARGKRDRDGSMSTSPQKLSKQKISAFFSSSNGYSNVAAPALTPPVTHGSNVGLSGGEIMSVSNIAASMSHFCEECQRTISEPRAEHADFHFALNLSQAQRSEVMASSSAPTKKRGPLDAFLKR